MGNFLKYTNLTYEEILTGIKNKIENDSRFENFKESAIAQLTYEIFAAVGDLCNYNLERRAEENYFDTCKLRSSAILLAKQLGYVVTRPIPAEAKIKMKITGDLTSKNIKTGDILQVPIYTDFTYDSNNYLLKNTISYTFTSADVASISATGEDYEKEITIGDDDEYFYVLQGERKQKIIEGETNDQVGQNFQIYKLEDSEFSNKYGDQDYDINITTVEVGQTSAAAVDYSIDRRSLINLESIENFVQGDEKKVCVVRTAVDENVEILFGDAQYAAIGANVSANGPITNYDNIYITYLATKGSKANKTGIIDESLNTDSTVLAGGADITGNIEFLFYSNLIGGADIEDIDSIKLNAPSVYYSLDRVVTKRDYIAYLKSLTSPIIIKNAVVWGEQDEMEDSTNEPIRKLFNVVLFSCLGSLYNLTGTAYSVKTEDNNLETAVLDLDCQEDDLKNENYFNIYVKQNIVDQLETYNTSGSYYILYGNDNLGIDLDDFKTKYDTQKLSITYTSDLYLSGYSVINQQTDEINISAVSTLSEIASEIQTELRLVTDQRGSSAINDNYGNYAFSAISCNYDSVNDRFIVSGSPYDSCYIASLSPELTASNYAFTNALGFYAKSSNKATLIINDNSLISDKITSVIDKLDLRSQVTVKNVYISPIIQNFNLNGTIYVNQLADKTDLLTSIKNDIYKWLDKNADFDTSIYLSNITDIIEEFPNVVYSNIEFSASTVSYTAYDSTSNTILNKTLYADETNLKTEFDNYYNILNVDLTLTERTFFNYTKDLYDSLTSSNNNHTPFRDTEDFITLVSDIHKIFLSRIKSNMIDSNGNIVNYSMPNEVAKINIALVATYKTV